MQRVFKILPEQQNTAVALGFFDGVHLGHRSVLDSAAREKENGLLPICFTFSESPKTVLSGSLANALMTEDDKLKALEQIGISKVIEADFLKIKDMSATDFFDEILVKRLRAKKLFCGFNYRFGRNGEGDVKLLESLCQKNNIGFMALPPARYDDKIVSSTLIRQLISEGDIKTANNMLCGRFGFSSVIEYGRQLGRTIGTPTINQPLIKELAVPKFGVYVSLITLENGEKYCGVTNIGIKPTVGGTIPLCETWMPEYRGGEIYGQKTDIRLLDFIRPEKKFGGLDELKTAIQNDSKKAVQIFNDMKIL